MLASAGDDGNILLWVPAENHAQFANFGEDGLEDKETWRVKHMCRSMGSEIYDLAWSPDGVFFITGSMDNIARIYNAQTGTIDVHPYHNWHILRTNRVLRKTNRRAQPLRPRCRLGSVERVCCNAVFGSVGAHLYLKDQGRPIFTLTTQQGHKNGPARSTGVLEQPGTSRLWRTSFFCGR